MDGDGARSGRTPARDERHALRSGWASLCCQRVERGGGGTRRGEWGGPGALGPRGGGAGTRRSHLRAGRLVVLDRVRLRRRREAHARRDDHRDRLARPRREPDHVLDGAGTAADDGRLFVSQCALGDHLFELDPDGSEEPRLITDQLGPGCGLNGMDWGPDDRLYGPRPAASEVVRVDVDRGTFETVASGFDRPVALKFDSQHRLHVLDSGTGELFRVDIANGEKELVGRTGAGSDNLAFDADDRLFVSSHTHGFIVEVLGPETNRTVVAGGVSFPGGLAWLPAAEGGGRLFLADRRALRELDPETGAEVHVVPGVGSDVGEALSAHPHGAQLLLSGATSVSIWDPDADRLVARFEGFEQAVDALPLGGDIIVSEYETGSVLRFNPASPDERTVLASGLEAPAGLAVHGGDLYVADRSGTLLQILDDGERMEPPRLVAGGLAGPEGIAADDDGTLYVVEEDAGRVTQVDPETGAATLVADGLTLQSLEQKSIGGATSVGFLSGIAVGDGSLYLSSYAENRVYRIDR